MLFTENNKNNRGYTAKECALLAVFVALVIAAQTVLSAIPGVEIVTVLFVAYSFSAGWERGMFAATAFSLLRQIVFGFFPTVLISYLVYYNLLTLCFGLLSARIKNPIKALPLRSTCVFGNGTVLRHRQYSNAALVRLHRASRTCLLFRVVAVYDPPSDLYSYLRNRLVFAVKKSLYNGLQVKNPPL